MAYQLPVSIETRQHKKPGLQIDYPQIKGLANPVIQKNINQTIVNEVQTMMKEQAQMQPSPIHEMVGHFEIKTNERGILSLQLSNYVMAKQAAHGYTMLRSLTFDINTGKQYSLSELFMPNQNYVFVISKMIQEQIRQRNIPLVEPFQSIHPNQSYYLADKALVIYFDLYKLAPYYYGFPMFPISVYDLQKIATPEGPLSILAADIA